ncbi:hypothetical protein Ahia01_000706500, partial [Argonauta hians]
SQSLSLSPSSSSSSSSPHNITTTITTTTSTHTGHTNSSRLKNILLPFLLLVVTLTDHTVSGQYHPSKGCKLSIQKGVSYSDAPYESEASRGYVINSMRLIRQMSITDCRHGNRYGYTLTTWWVKDGCAAKFQIEECLIADCVIRIRSGSNPYLVATYHPATPGFHIKHVRVWEQTSYYPCRPGSTLFYNETMWWLDKGCEGRFQILECPSPLIDHALSPTESTGDGSEGGGNIKSNRQHYNFDRYTVPPDLYPSQRRKDALATRTKDKRTTPPPPPPPPLLPHEVESSGNINVVSGSKKSDSTTTGRRGNGGSSNLRLLTTTGVLVVVISLATLALL